MTPIVSQDPLQELGPASRGRIYAELREQRPVCWSPAHSAWVMTRYADVRSVLLHPEVLPVDVMPFLDSLSRRGNLDLSSLIRFSTSLSLLTRPPNHEGLRKMLAKALGGIRRINLTELLERRANLLLDRGEQDGVIDLAAGYSRKLALFVISTFLGVPEEDVPALGDLAFDLMAIFEAFLPSVRMLTVLNNSAAALMDYFERLIRARRRNPGDDGASLMVALADEQLQCSDEELAGYCTFFFIAAEETTSAGIAGACHILLQRPDLRERLCRDPALIPAAARELLRLVTPVQYVMRQLRIDTQVGGQLIPAGEVALLVLGAANRDPAAFPDPDEPVIERSGPESMVFAPGPYRCVGGQLAAFELELAVRKLIERPEIRFIGEAPVWTERRNISPLKHLKVTFEKQDR
jgi:pimeloyl-[acyl-carrier protein] synthase